MSEKSSPSSEEIPNIHWADHAAEDLIKQHPTKDHFVCASGISPSGMVHIGNFREVITVDFVVRSLVSRGKKVRFIYSWDDYDALRKAPVNLPNQDLIKANLRKPLSGIPDPYGQDHSYAAHFEREFEEGLAPLEVKPEYLRQNQPYRNAEYKDGIKTALERKNEIAAILNRWRTEPLPESWTCVSVFCGDCKKDTTEVKAYAPPYQIHYRCQSCKKDNVADFSQPESGVKLLWRVDWPMRWAKEGVDFEPGGKDHSSPGGSYETGTHIVREIWKKEPPFYVQYDFVLVKGGGAKLSSSSGQLITLQEALAIYEPSVLRWIFASRKPNIDFSIAFDLDVIKAYDDFDRTTRVALRQEEADDRKFGYEKRIYELSITSDYPAPEAQSAASFPQFGFRHLCNILQIHEGNLEKTVAHYASTFQSEHDGKRLLARATRAWTWLTQFAPPEFQFRIRDISGSVPKSQFPEATQKLVAILARPDVEKMSEEALHSEIYNNVIKAQGIEPKAFFQEVYTLLINKAQGPKLAAFLLAMGTKRAAALIEKSL